MGHIILTILATLSLNAVAKGFDLYRFSGLREHQPLIIEIKNVKVRHCPECHVPLTLVSYEIEAADAFLQTETTNTSTGPVYSAVIKPYAEKVELNYPEGSTPHRPFAGRYVGTLWQACAPWAMGADGSCRQWEIKYQLNEVIRPL